MSLRLLLVAKEGPAREAYLEAFETEEVTVDTISSLADLYDVLKQSAYNGIMVDVPTIVKATNEEKVVVNELLEMFPVVRLNWDARHNKVRPLFYGRPTADTYTVRDFIDNECNRFEARIARVTPRHPIHLNVLLFKEGRGVNRSPERSITQDISESGCFAIAFEDWRDVSSAWIIFQDFKDRTPIQAEVKWQIHWGDQKRIPGLGLAFVRMSDAQREEIRQCLERPTLSLMQE